MKHSRLMLHGWGEKLSEQRKEEKKKRSSRALELIPRSGTEVRRPNRFSWILLLRSPRRSIPLARRKYSCHFNGQFEFASSVAIPESPVEPQCEQHRSWKPHAALIPPFLAFARMLRFVSLLVMFLLYCSSWHRRCLPIVRKTPRRTSRRSNDILRSIRSYRSPVLARK